MINIFLVNVIALFAFSVPIPDVGARLGLLSGTLVAVTAYQSVINAVIPWRGRGLGGVFWGEEL